MFRVLDAGQGVTNASLCTSIEALNMLLFVDYWFLLWCRQMKYSDIHCTLLAVISLPSLVFSLHFSGSPSKPQVVFLCFPCLCLSVFFSLTHTHILHMKEICNTCLSCSNILLCNPLCFLLPTQPPSTFTALRVLTARYNILLTCCLCRRF